MRSEKCSREGNQATHLAECKVHWASLVDKYLGVSWLEVQFCLCCSLALGLLLWIWCLFPLLQIIGLL